METVQKFFVTYDKTKIGYYKMITRRSDDLDCPAEKIVVNGIYAFDIESVVDRYIHEHPNDPICCEQQPWEPFKKSNPVIYIGEVYFQLTSTYDDVYPTTNTCGLCYRGKSR